MNVLVGDIHGCIEEFDELRKKLALRKGKDRLILLGDLVDRGPDSVGVVRRAMEQGDECVLGNHEEKHLRFRREYFAWKARGSNPRSFPTTLSRKAIDTHVSIKQKEWDWIAALPNTIRVNEAVLAVHAGFEPARALADQRPEKMWRIRYVSKKGFWKDGVPYYIRPKGGYFWSEKWPGPDSVVYGHTSFREPRVDLRKEGEKVRGWCVGIDTGCCYGNFLTAQVIHEDPKKGPEFVPVKAKHEYLPLKKDKGD